MSARRAQCFHVNALVTEEIEARDWSTLDLARRMGGDVEANLCVLDLMTLEAPGLLLGKEVAEKLARAFGTSAELWLNADAAWQEWSIAERN